MARDFKGTSGEPLKMYPKRDSLTFSGGIVWFEKRVYIPGSLRQSYLSRCHEGHQGIVKCKRAARQHFWWPGSSRDIEDLIAPKRVSPGVIRDEHPKRELTPETGVPEPGLKGLRSLGRDPKRTMTLGTSDTRGRKPRGKSPLASSRVSYLL